jgi:nitronate monooxygenase
MANAIRDLNARPSSCVGAFYDWAMAIANLMERLAFLNRWQGWVRRQLRDMLPKIRDDGLHGALSEMLQRHEAKIELVHSTLPRR